MVIAGEASGDALAAQLVRELRSTPRPAGSTGSLEFFGAGGPKLAEAGVNLAVDMTAHAVIGLGDVLRSYATFRRIFKNLLKLAIERRPDLIILVDFSGFNRRFARAVREYIHRNGETTAGWSPRIVQFVSPQVWASRPGRAGKMAQDIDLLLCIFPFEKDWYARRTPNLRVEFVGHPIFDRYAGQSFSSGKNPDRPLILLLPGSRRGELKRHFPVMIAAAERIRTSIGSAVFRAVVPSDELKTYARTLCPLPEWMEIQTGQLPQALSGASLALASTGTVLIECAWFGVPTVAMYKTSWSTYQIGKRIVQVKYLSMPNILADAEVMPEFVQDAATAENLSRAALEILQDPVRQKTIQAELARIIASLGTPGATQRAAQAIASLFENNGVK